MRMWLKRIGWMTAGIGGLYVVSALASVATGGSLDPPPGAPAPTMKTLEEIPGTWSRKLVSSGGNACDTARFTCVLDGWGARDNETGLVWEKSPTTALMSWSAAQVACGNASIGGRGGWRLPTDTEMRSLLDPASGDQPMLPANHPFDIYVPHGTVWTSSPVTIETDLAYVVDTDTLDRLPALRSQTNKKWCVRGVQADAPEDSELAEQPPAWYRALDATGGCLSERFRCVLNDAAVLDRETGLVWQRAYTSELADWATARNRCLSMQHGGRYGFRLPATEEMKTLFHTTTPDRLPVGHPFTGVPTGLALNFWTATTSVVLPEYAYAFGTASFGGGEAQFAKSSTYLYFCVRGGVGYDNR